MKNALALGILLFVVLFVLAVETSIRFWQRIVVLLVAFAILALSVHYARARDLGQWQTSDPAVREWYQSLMRPDAPSASCCGEADAYWADEVHVRNGKTFARITDDRPDEPLGRPHLEIGTEIEIPPEKLKWDRSNPTGHNILFMSRALYAWCLCKGAGSDGTP